MALSFFPQGSPERLAQLMDQPMISREIIVDQAASLGSLSGSRGLFIEVRLPSYRSLPLACIEKISVELDGQLLELSEAMIRIDSKWYSMQDLPTLTEVWWFILDFATLFVPVVPTPGIHQVAVEIVRVEPYITAGRFSFTNTSNAQIDVKEAACG